MPLDVSLLGSATPFQGLQMRLRPDRRLLGS
jgi:hypothetical protein